MRVGVKIEINAALTLFSGFNFIRRSIMLSFYDG